MSKVVYCREAFKRTAWEFHSADGVATYLFLFAMQNPYYIQFARLESVEHFVEMKALGVHNWDEIAMNTVTRRFLCSAGEGFVRWDALLGSLLGVSHWGPKLCPQTIIRMDTGIFTVFDFGEANCASPVGDRFCRC